MKITTGILGCALVAGLMTFASGNAHAKNLVISNEVYVPFNLKLDVQYPDNDGKKFKKATLTSKQYLKDTYPTGAKLLVNAGTREVWVADKNDALVANLATNETLVIGLSFVVQVQPNTSKQTYDQVGTFSVSSSSDDNFYVAGKFFRKYSRSNTDKKGEFTYKDDLKSKDLSGTGNFVGLSEEDLPTIGSADYKGSAKLTPPPVE